MGSSVTKYVQQLTDVDRKYAANIDVGKLKNIKSIQDKVVADKSDDVVCKEDLIPKLMGYLPRTIRSMDRQKSYKTNIYTYKRGDPLRGEDMARIWRWWGPCTMAFVTGEINGHDTVVMGRFLFLLFNWKYPTFFPLDVNYTSGPELWYRLNVEKPGSLYLMSGIKVVSEWKVGARGRIYSTDDSMRKWYNSLDEMTNDLNYGKKRKDTTAFGEVKKKQQRTL